MMRRTFVVAAMLIACPRGDRMKQLEERWAEVSASTTAHQVPEAVERVWEPMGEDHVSLRMLATTPDGREVDMIHGGGACTPRCRVLTL